MTTTGPGRPAPGHRALFAAGALAAAAALLAGCGGYSSSTGGGSTGPGPSGTAGQQAPAALTTEHDPTLGTLVADGQGHTLYRFDRDSADPPASHCTDACATLWPPELADATGGVPASTGIDAHLLGTVTRADGSHQLTLGGRPLYRYAPDSRPGDTKGQGVDGTWYAATPTGDRAMPTAGPAMPSGGY
ncbi:hypothetical protein ACIQBJ_18720 [Kitasatospora sp. NPDC088391]|uniref:COG4315 family predicted lipoprotein n=1 Tax=Kitasatospora sp. NPDC088391 TaxID=3364074 RepID=UPI0038239782